MIELKVHSVLYSLLSRHRVIVLREVSGERFLPIFIGTAESESIALRLQGARMARPLTHDLLVNVIAEMGGVLEYVLITELSDNTYYARLAFRQGGQVLMSDSRSSDAIAVALRASAPIYAEELVMDAAGIVESPALAVGNAARAPAAFSAPVAVLSRASSAAMPASSMPPRRARLVTNRQRRSASMVKPGGTSTPSNQAEPSPSPSHGVRLNRLPLPHPPRVSVPLNPFPRQIPTPASPNSSSPTTAAACPTKPSNISLNRVSRAAVAAREPALGCRSCIASSPTTTATSKRAAPAPAKAARSA